MHLLLAGYLLLAATALCGQSREAPESPPYKFYSGSVVEFSAGRISVLREVPGRTAGPRSFLITPQTRIDGKPQVKARVTVAYTDGEGGDTAVRIIVRTPPKKPAAKRPAK